MPDLADLPPPPAGRSEWPWRAQHEGALGPAPARGWPRITIVTPSFNQGEFVEAAVRSVLLQGYPNLEFIVLDGGSADDSADIIRRYAPWLTHWNSGRDGGQADALATGFGMATGEIYGWLNSDDILLPGALKTAAALLSRRRRVDAVYGNRLVIDRGGAVTGRHVWPWWLTKAHWALGQPLAQECCFWRRELYEKVGGIDRTHFFIMDYDLFYRMWRVGKFRKTMAFLGCLRSHEETKNARHADVWRRELAEAKHRFRLEDPGYIRSRILHRLDRIQLRCEELMIRLRGSSPEGWGDPSGS